MREHVIVYSVVENVEDDEPEEIYMCFNHAVVRAMYAPVRTIKTQVVHVGHYNRDLFACEKCIKIEETFNSEVL